MTDKSIKNSKTNEEAIFKLFSLGVVTNRDEWVYDFSKQKLADKMNFFFDMYEREFSTLFDAKNKKIKEFVNDDLSQEIKWTRALKNQLRQGKKVAFEEEKILRISYRPFTKKFLCYVRKTHQTPSFSKKIA